MKLHPFKDELCYVTDEVSTIPTYLSNTTYENRVKFTTDLAAISRGKSESNNPETRFLHLLKEAATNPTDLNNLYDVVVKELNESNIHLYDERSGETVKLNSTDDKYKEIIYYEETIRYTDEYPTGVLTLPGYLYSTLFKHQDYNKKASRPLEFLPVVLYIMKTEEGYKIELNNAILVVSLKDFIKLCKFGYLEEIIGIEDYYRLYTNFRNVYNYLRDVYLTHSNVVIANLVPYNSPEDLQNFRAIKLRTGMYNWAQLVTHTQISTESQSDRVSEEKNYWLPDDLDERIYNVDLDTIKDDKIKQEIRLLQVERIPSDEFEEKMLNQWSQNLTQSILKYLGYKREIWSRAPYYFKYKEFVMTGWVNDPSVWNHLLLEREAYPNIHKSWVQPETVKIVDAIRQVITK